MPEIDHIETGLACEKCRSEDISGSITRTGKIACSKCISVKKDPWLWETYEGIGDLEASPEVRPNPQFEGTTPKKEGVGMFESDLWEHGIPRTSMHGPWTLPPARGGFLHTPTITSPRSSKYYVPIWQKVRTYALDHPEKAVKDIAKDLGLTVGQVSTALMGKEGKGDFARYHSDLDRIIPAQTTTVKRIESTKRRLSGFGPDSEVDEREAVKERVIELFKEKTLGGFTTQADAIEEIQEELSIGYRLVKDWITEAGIYSREKGLQERGGKASRTWLARKGTTPEDIEEYLRVFGQESTDKEVADALGISPEPIDRMRKKLELGSYKASKRDKEAKRIQTYILSQNDYMTSQQMAEALNVSPATVGVHRKRLGLKSLGKQVGALSKARGGVKYQKRYEEIKDYLLEYAGKIPDSQIIKNLGISSKTLYLYREALGLSRKRGYYNV